MKNGVVQLQRLLLRGGFVSTALHGLMLFCFFGVLQVWSTHGLGMGPFRELSNLEKRVQRVTYSTPGCGSRARAKL